MALEDDLQSDLPLPSRPPGKTSRDVQAWLNVEFQQERVARKILAVVLTSQCHPACVVLMSPVQNSTLLKTFDKSVSSSNLGQAPGLSSPQGHWGGRLLCGVLGQDCGPAGESPKL